MGSLFHSVKYILRTFFQLDVRALSLMRIAVALVSLTDLVIRFADIPAFYLESGVSPYSVIQQFMPVPNRIHAHALFTNDLAVYVLFVVHAFCLLVLLAGYHTRSATFFCWLLLLLEHNRNPLILQGGDDLLRLTLFWALFLPWGHRYSIDAIRRENNHTNNSLASFASMAYVLQICYVYFFSALLKGNEWHTDFTAVYYAYHLDQIALPLAKVISNYPVLMKAFTAAAFLFELLIPILILFPSSKPMMRTIAVCCIVFFHLWNGVTIYIGLFFLIGIATAIGLLSPNVMNIIDERLGAIRCNVFINRQAEPTHIATPYNKPRSLLTKGIVVVLMVYVFMWNGSTGSISSHKLSDKARGFGEMLRLDQSWGMFAPAVLKDDGWLVYEAVLHNGDTVDLNRNAEPVNYQKPANGVALFKSDRWRKFTENYTLIQFGFIRPHLCMYLIKNWNEKHPEKKIRQLNILFFREVTLPDYQYSIPQKETLCGCP